MKWNILSLEGFPLPQAQHNTPTFPEMGEDNVERYYFDIS